MTLRNLRNSAPSGIVRIGKKQRSCASASCIPTATRRQWARSSGAQFLTQLRPAARCYCSRVCRPHQGMRPRGCCGAPERRRTRTMDGAKLPFGGSDNLRVCVWGAAPACLLSTPWVPLIPPPPPTGRCFSFHSGGGGGLPPGPPAPLPWTPSPGPPPPLLPSALIHLRIRVLGTLFRLGQFFPPAPSAHL